MDIVSGNSKPCPDKVCSWTAAVDRLFKSLFQATIMIIVEVTEKISCAVSNDTI